jgi:hypothetical protein
MKAAVFSLLISAGSVSFLSAAASWQVADTGQDFCYDEGKPITPPKQGGRFSGQDAQYSGAAPAYRDNGDGTVTDLTTGLMWSKAVDPRKVVLAEARGIAKGMALGGHTDWRVPNIKELYSLIDFRGVTGLAPEGDFTKQPATSIPYINTDYFDFLYGDTKAGERFIDAQWLSDTPYTATTMGGMETLFGVNFADGRIKGYGLRGRDGKPKKFYARYVRGPAYGQNDFADNGDGTVTDRATGLIWAKADSGRSMTWEEALRYAENSKLAGQEDWRLPNAKELQSLVDYTRSPEATGSPAIDPIFQTTAITSEAGQKDWPFFWASTTHLDGPNALPAVYVAFGRALGSLHGQVMDVHGAGAQRSDPKVGQPRIGFGPQGDAQRSKNFVRCVRGGNVTLKENLTRADNDPSKYPHIIRVAGQAKKPQPLDFTRPSRPPGNTAGLSGQMPGGNSPGQGQLPGQQPGQNPAPGQPMPGAGGGTNFQQAEFIKRHDRNGDGKVSRNEFPGPREHFKEFDKNKDNAITIDEAPTGPPPPGPGGPQGPGGRQGPPR